MEIINKINYREIKLYGETIIFINDVKNQSGNNQTLQLNDTIYKYTGQNIIDVLIYKKECIQKTNQKNIIDTQMTNDGLLKSIQEKQIENKSINDKLLEILTSNERNKLEYKQKQNIQSITLDEYTINKNNIKIIEYTELINKNQLLEKDLELQYNIKENVLKHFDIKPIINDLNKKILSIKDDIELLKIVYQLKINKEIKYKDSLRWGMKCICTQNSCSNLFLIRNIDNNLFFAVGSDCIERIHPELIFFLDL